jgi:hypothetical protein
MSTYFFVEPDKFAILGERTIKPFPHTQKPNPNPAAIDLALRVMLI